MFKKLFLLTLIAYGSSFGASSSTTTTTTTTDADPSQDRNSLRNICARYIAADIHNPAFARLHAGLPQELVELITTKTWNTATCTGTLRLTSNVRSMALSPNGSLLYLALVDGTIEVWDTRTNALITTLNEGTDVLLGITCLAVNREGTRLYSGSGNGTINTWNTTSNALVARFVVPSSITSLALSLDGSLLYISLWDRTIRVWDTTRNILVTTLRGHADWVNCLAISPDGTRLYSGSDDRCIKIWDTSNNTCIATLTGHTSNVSSLALNPEGSQLYSGTDNGEIFVWNTFTKAFIRLLARAGDGNVFCLKTNNDGSLLYSGGNNGSLLYSGGNNATIRIWDTYYNRLIATLPYVSEWRICLALSPDDSKLYAVGGDTIRIWQPAPLPATSQTTVPDVTHSLTASSSQSTMPAEVVSQLQNPALAYGEQLYEEMNFAPDVTPSLPATSQSKLQAIKNYLYSSALPATAIGLTALGLWYWLKR